MSETTERRRLHGLLRQACAVLCLLAAPGAEAASQPASEYGVKAAFLLNFTKFIEWPASAFDDAKSPLAICILGEDPFDGILDQLVTDEVVGERRLVVKRMRKTPAPKTCQVLFIGPGERDVPGVIAASGPGVLTVGERDQFLHEGGIIAFVVSDRRVHFDINQEAATKASLTISARLLSVARSVQR